MTRQMVWQSFKSIAFLKLPHLLSLEVVDLIFFLKQKKSVRPALALKAAVGLSSGLAIARSAASSSQRLEDAAPPRAAAP